MIGLFSALIEEKSDLSTKLKTLEKDISAKTHRPEKDKVTDELKSKLKAAETLCETLMDENEDMKKEIRDLEEEIYEMQDNFRQEIFHDSPDAHEFIVIVLFLKN